jgi:shikimate kinase
MRADFFDTDAAIERRIGQPIRAFFDSHGEAAFRELETEVLASLVAEPSTRRVLATGGGIVLKPANRELLRQHACVVYLHSMPEELFKRLRHDTARPLLQVKDPLAKLRELYGQRHPLYQEVAHFTVETGRPSISTLVSMILMQLELAGVVDPESSPPASD